jgi:hypothetical protein
MKTYGRTKIKLHHSRRRRLSSLTPAETVPAAHCVRRVAETQSRREKALLPSKNGISIPQFLSHPGSIIDLGKRKCVKHGPTKGKRVVRKRRRGLGF